MFYKSVIKIKYLEDNSGNLKIATVDIIFNDDDIAYVKAFFSGAVRACDDLNITMPINIEMIDVKEIGNE